MVKSDSIQENTRMEIVESIIINALLKGEHVIIPDFGHLEVRSLGEKRTIFFKVTKTNDDSISLAEMDEQKEAKDIYQVISTPLKEWKAVNLPRIGIFRPVKRENGEIYISFIPSLQLRMLLSDEEEKRKELLKTPSTGVTEGDNQSVAINNSNNNDTEFKYPPKSVFQQNNKIKKDATTVLQNDNGIERRRWKNISGILLPVVALIALVVVIGINIHTRREKAQVKVLENKEQRNKIITAGEFLNLPALAEQHYGNSAFWVYIYKANEDKLDSPINIPKNVSLIFPDLKADFDVNNVNDSMEIRRANIIADLILREKSIATKNSKRDTTNNKNE